MALTKTLLQLRTAVRQRADMENSLFVADSEITDRLNSSARMVYHKIVKTKGDAFFGTTTTITTSPNTATYALPSNFFKIGSYGVWWLIAAGQNVRLNRYTPSEALAFFPNQGWSYYPYGQLRSNIRYDLFGGQLRFLPTPLAVYSVTVHYIPYQTPLAADGDTLDTLGGFEEAVIWDTVATCLSKQESDPSFALAQRDREIENLLENIDPDQNEPPQVQWVNAISYEDI